MVVFSSNRFSCLWSFDGRFCMRMNCSSEYASTINAGKPDWKDMFKMSNNGTSTCMTLVSLRLIVRLRDGEMRIESDK